MILGGICTRSCRFCATPTGKPLPPDPQEPLTLAQTVHSLGLKHAVITSVDRDDLPDGGAAHWAQTIRAIRLHNPLTSIEVLLPDFMGKPQALETALAAHPDIAAHNLETVERLTPTVRSRARYRYSLEVLKRMVSMVTAVKSGLMLGLGETQQEVHQTLHDLRDAGCRILTLGQYLQPTRQHHPVMRYLSPEEFTRYGDYAYSIGFTYVEAGPLVRSSFHADRALEACGIKVQEASQR